VAFERLRLAAKRLGASIHRVLGAALAGGIAGVIVAAVLPVPTEPMLPATAPGLNRLVGLTSGAFLGWWVGLLGGLVYLTLRRRRS
jgi:hypothetical protein